MNQYQEVLPIFLTQDIEKNIVVDKISFGVIHSSKKADISKAIQNAIQMYEDGVVRIFQNDIELTNLNAKVNLQETDCFTFIRLTFLPFVDDDPKTAEIMSKIILLAEDQKIKDPGILRQF